MKKFRTGMPFALFFLSLVFSHLPVAVRGIPNSFGALTTFINPAGMRLEDFAAQEHIWNPRAELKGTWELWKDEAVTDPTIELLHLAMPAIVFGVPASEVTVQRKDDRILQFRVVFAPYERIKEFDRLNQTIRTNAAIWSGSTASSDTMNHGVSVYSFEAKPDAEQVVVTIRPR